MSVIIQNISKHPTPTGRNEYEVRINYEKICYLTHEREDGLATLLRRAADAVQRVAKEKP